MEDRVQVLYDRCVQNHPGLAGDQLKSICNLALLINIYENKLESMIDTNKKKGGIQFEIDANLIPAARTNYQTLKIDGPHNLKKRADGLKTWLKYLVSNNIKDDTDELVIMYERSRQKLDIHRNAMNSALKAYEHVLYRTGNKDILGIKDKIKLMAANTAHKDEIRLWSMDITKMAATSKEVIHEDVRNIINECIKQLIGLCREWQLSSAMDQSYYQALTRNLVNRRKLYNELVRIVNEVQSKSKLDSNSMTLMLPPEVTTTLLRCRQAMENDHKNFREWCKTRLKGVITMAAVDDTLKWNIHNVRYLDDKLKRVQDQLKVG